MSAGSTQLATGETGSTVTEWVWQRHHRDVGASAGGRRWECAHRNAAARCTLYGGCDCGDDRDRLFDTTANCATACAEQGYYDAAALTGGGIASTFAEGALCNDVFVCARSWAEAELGKLLDLSSACESTGFCPVTTCPTPLSGASMPPSLLLR
ncbi:MAG: hypothetical protein JW751_30570 [Polyangiaceae bacterium]|nr:hypothetical protein [Polyangiaceae bacterium]